MTVFTASEIPKRTPDTWRKTPHTTYGGAESDASGKHIRPNSICIVITVNEYLLHV